MRAIDAITAHYDSNKRQSIEVPEWGIAIHWTLLTVAERAKLVAVGETDADVLVRKALNEDGSKMFEIADAQRLRDNADAAVVTRVAAAILGQSKVTKRDVEDAGKN